MSGKRKRRGAQPSDSAVTSKKAKVEQPSAATKFEKKPFVKDPHGEERRREGTLYDLLGSEDEADRLAAAECIISSLLDGEGVPESILQRHLDRRLFRGLASGRNASRIGFSLVITELLGQLFGSKNLAETKYTGLSYEQVLGFLMDKTSPGGQVPGQEERDHFFGQLFGLECFVRSGIVFSEESRWNKILGLLLRLAYKKVWLRSQCGWVIVQAIGQMDKKQIQSTLEKVAESGIARTPEGVAIWLVALNRFPDLKVKPWNHPLSNKSLSELTAVLKESLRNQPDEDDGKKSKQANWTAQLHFVWDIILAHYAKETIKAEELEPFWSHVVDDGLFSKKATEGQKFKGFTVFQKMLGGLIGQRSKLVCLFSKNLLICLMNQSAKEDRFLHRAATKALNALESAVAAEPSSLAPVLGCLLGKNGAYAFDQRTETKIVGKLLQNINNSNEEECLEIMRQPIKRLKQMEKAEAQTVLRTYIDYLSKSQQNSEGVALGVPLKELASLAYSSLDIPDELLTEQIREMCRTRLESSFARLIRRSDDFSIFCQAVLTIDPGAMSIDAEIKASVDEALSRMKKLLKQKTSSPAEKSLTEALAVLHAVAVLQLYNEDPDAMEVLQDLQQLSQRVKKGKVDDESGSSELLVETLLSMVARPSSLMREVSQQVFEAFTSNISAEGLELLTGPLSSGESTKGQQELFNADGADMDVDEGSGSDEDQDGDEEDEDGDGSDEASDVEVQDIDSDVEFVDVDGEDEDDEDSEDKPEPIDIDDIMGNILKSHRLDKDDEAESSDDDQDMSDSEMLALDDKLAEVIKQRVKDKPDAKKQKKEAKQSVVNFKHRILDLLDIYVKKEPLNPLSFSLLVPLLRLMRSTSTKPLATRACGTILDYQKSLKKARSNKEDAEGIGEVDGLMETLIQVHGEATLDDAHAYAKAASAASLIVASTMCYKSPASIKQVLAVYAKTQEARWLGKNKLQPAFFTDWNNWFMSTAS